MALDDEKFGIDSYQDENGCEGETQGGSDDPFEVVGDFTIREIWCDSRRRRQSRDLLELFPEGRANVYHGWADFYSFFFFFFSSSTLSWRRPSFLFWPACSLGLFSLTFFPPPTPLFYFTHTLEDNIWSAPIMYDLCSCLPLLLAISVWIFTPPPEKKKRRKVGEREDDWKNKARGRSGEGGFFFWEGWG